MVNDVSETSSAFAETACKLLVEYTARLMKQKQDVLAILSQYHDMRGSKINSEYLRQRYDSERDQFYQSREVFETLSRKVSQWVEHGRAPKPHLELELAVRLADFESTMRAMESFFHLNEM